jgi:plastocyanin
MKGARALAGGTLVLGLCCAIPAISAAQDAGTTTTSTTTTTPTQPQPPSTVPSTPPADQPNKEPKPPAEAPPTAPAPGTPSEAAANTRETSTQVGQASSGSGPVGGAHKSASATVTMGDLFFSPASVSVAVGDTVTWRNTGQAPHNAVANDGSFQTPVLNNGQSASETFSTAGTFSYICTIHPQMKGTVRVLSSGGGGGEGGGGGGGGAAGSTGSGTSEASAVASPDAAGDANTLPMTGMAAGGLALVGFGLLVLGLIVRQADRERSRPRWLPIF